MKGFWIYLFIGGGVGTAEELFMEPDSEPFYDSVPGYLGGRGILPFLGVGSLTSRS